MLNENCYCQIKPVNGNIEKNIEKHIQFINSAVSKKVDLIMFLEMSLIGYEPDQANELAIDIDDKRLLSLQKSSDMHNVTICVRAPTKKIAIYL